MEIIEIEKNELYNGFLSNNEHLVFHTFAYKKFIEEAFDCKYEIKGVVENDKIKTILPLVEIRSKMFGNKVISSAYIEYGGFAGDDNYVDKLISFVEDKYQGNNNYLEIRGGFNEEKLPSRLIKKNLYKRFVLDFEKLPSNSGNRSTSGRVPSVWEARIMANIQKSKRKAIKKSWKYIKVKEITSFNQEFYNLYCRNMRNFGSPGYSKKYFESFYENIVKNNFGRIYGGYYEKNQKEILVAALLGFHYKDRVHILIAVSDPKFQQYRPNDGVHYHFIEWAMRYGYRYFDFGRVREESGQFKYKKKWGPELKELPSYFLSLNGEEIPVVDPSRYDLVLKAWRKMPLGVTKLVGMKLRKGLGI